MAAKSLVVGCIAVFSLFMVADAEAAKAKPKAAKGDPLVVRGCTHYQPPFCLGVTAGGKTYTLFDARPPIPRGVGVDVYGKTGGFSPCFGTPVKVTSWKRNRLKCPAR